MLLLNEFHVNVVNSLKTNGKNEIYPLCIHNNECIFRIVFSIRHKWCTLYSLLMISYIRM